MNKSKWWIFEHARRYPLYFFLLLSSVSASAQVVVHVLGVTQDAGRPQLGCRKSCCLVGNVHGIRIPVVSLGVTQTDPKNGILLEATPDIVSQWQHFTQLNQGAEPSSIFITHGHMGHYSGLIQLGREARNTNGLVVYGHPTLIDFFQKDQPWKQLITLKNIQPISIRERETIRVGEMGIRGLVVPHRDEISSTYTYLLEGPNKRALFLPDIDKWEKWSVSIDSLLQKVDYAFLDATFFDESELPNRKLSEIPHPTVRETMERAKDWPLSVRQKVYLIHFNHTNPLLNPESSAYKEVIRFGFRIAEVGGKVDL